MWHLATLPPEQKFEWYLKEITATELRLHPERFVNLGRSREVLEVWKHAMEEEFIFEIEEWKKAGKYGKWLPLELLLYGLLEFVTKTASMLEMVDGEDVVKSEYTAQAFEQRRWAIEKRGPTKFTPVSRR